MKHLTRSDLSNFRYLSQGLASPNRRYLAYKLSRVDVEKNSYPSHLRVWDSETQRDLKMTSEAIGSTYTWLDDEHLLFVANREEGSAESKKTQVYCLSLHGGEAEHWATIDLPVIGLEVVDQNRLLLQVAMNGDELKAKEAQDEALEKKLEEEAKDECVVIEEAPFWSDGGSYTAGSWAGLYLYTHADGSVERLTSLDERVYLADVKRNGKGEVTDFLALAFPIHVYFKFYSKLYQYELATRTQTQVLAPEPYLSQDCFMMHSAHYLNEGLFVVANNQSKYGLNQNNSFYRYQNGQWSLIREDGHLGDSVGADVSLGGGAILSLSEDKQFVDYICTEGTSSRLYRVELKSGEKQVLQTEVGAVRSMERLRDGLYFVGLRGLKAEELYRLEADGRETQLTQHNAWLNEYERSTPKSLFFEYKGERQEGFVLVPINSDEAKAPALLCIHGGPKTVYGQILHHEMQMLVAQGYYVFYTNPRGSDGYGDDWADIRGRYGEIDYEQLMAFTDAVLEAYPSIDAKRLGVMGGSYGGFMTNWITSHTTRFSAACTQRSISNWFSMYGLSDIGYFFTQDQTAANPWDNPEKLWAQSPLNYVRAVKTPTLIIHSDADYRCPLAEGQQWLTALKLNRVEARLVVFRGANHNLSRTGKPKQRLRRLSEIESWFARHLGACPVEKQVVE